MLLRTRNGGARMDGDVDAFDESYRISEYLRMLGHKDLISVREGLAARRLVVKRHFLSHYWGGPPRWRLAIRRVNRTRTLPDFVCVGAIKSGTSDLSTYLFQHPSVVPPLTKEIFSDNPEQWRAHYPTTAQKARVQAETGAASTGYFAPWMHHIPLMDAFRATQPDGKVVITLRDPVDRAYSHYKWDLLLGGRRLLMENPYYRTYSDYVRHALALFPATPMPSRSGFPLLQSGIYVRSVAGWRERFGTRSVHVMAAEDFFRDPVETVVDVQRFLGLRSVAPTLHRGAVNVNHLVTPPEDKDARVALAEFYRPWNEELYDLLDRDLGWFRAG